MSKYSNRKCRVDNIVFDSRREARRYTHLLLLERAGEIHDLQLQVRYELIPNQYEPSTEVYTRGIHKGEPKPGKLLERKVEYIADFVYKTKDGKTVVEDAKGVRTEVFKLKKKLMLLVHNIHIREV